MTEIEFKEFVGFHEWTFAKSMPKFPHCYVVRANCRDNEEFTKAVTFIRTAGDVRRWFKCFHTYYDMGEHSYWTMGNPVDTTIIINRSALYVGHKVSNSTSRVFESEAIVDRSTEGTKDI